MCRYAQTEAVFDATGSLKFFNINTGAENIGRLEEAAYELRLSNVTLSGIYTANNIIAETNVNVTGTAQLKAGVSVTLKPGFRAAEGCSLIVSIDNTLVVEPEKYYYVKDHLGSTRVTVDEEGKIASYYDYDPWGMVLDGRSGNNGISNEKYKFTGKERDDETNYDYFGARYYDARIGRWLQMDPLWANDFSWSPYNYVRDNPYGNIDPDGKDWKKAFRHFISAIGYGAETVNGAALTYGAITAAEITGNPVSVTGVMVGSGLLLHGGFSFSLQVYNTSVEAARSILGDESFGQKGAEGAIEYIVSGLSKDPKHINTAKMADMLVNTLGSEYGGGMQLASNLKMAYIEKIISMVEDGKSIIEITKEILTQYKQDIERQREEERKKEEERKRIEEAEEKKQ